MHILKYIVLLILVFIVSCSTVKDSGKANNYNSNKVAPGYCRIKGTIVKIDSTLEQGNSPCSKEPCLAVVHVDSILGYGAGFGTINNGSDINLKFEFTLGPTTKELFPNITERLPGLNINSQFIANIKHYFESGSKEKKYLVYGYKKL
jgi:hypothetical protein